MELVSSLQELQNFFELVEQNYDELYNNLTDDDKEKLLNQYFFKKKNLLIDYKTKQDKNELSNDLLNKLYQIIKFIEKKIV